MDVCLAGAYRLHASLACRVYSTNHADRASCDFLFHRPEKKLRCVYCSGCCRVRVRRDNERKTIIKQPRVRSVPIGKHVLAYWPVFAKADPLNCVFALSGTSGSKGNIIFVPSMARPFRTTACMYQMKFAARPSVTPRKPKAARDFGGTPVAGVQAQGIASNNCPLSNRSID